MDINCLGAAYSRDKSATHFGLAVEGRCLTHAWQVRKPMDVDNAPDRSRTTGVKEGRG